MPITLCSKEEFIPKALESIIPVESVVDVGAGIRPQTFFIPSTHVIVEPFKPYIDRLKESSAFSSHMVILNGTWDQVLPFFPDKSVDTVFALDVIEHFKKEAGFKFINQAERIARKQVVIFTPSGMYEQSYDDESKADRWGMQGGFWQSHRSGWKPEDFNGDWELLVCNDFHQTDQYDEVLHEPFGAFWAIKTIQKNAALPENRLHLSELTTIFLVQYCFQRIKSGIYARLQRWFSVKR
ncbi:MAG: hypothetical protein C0410_16155 [Anaerolinea sp.]|nr:hypothetical protein [Anaerolinea sp.]